MMTTKTKLQQLLEETGDMALSDLSYRARMPERSVWRIVHGQSASTQPRTAKKLLAGINERRAELKLPPVQLDALGLTLRGAEAE